MTTGPDAAEWSDFDAALRRASDDLHARRFVADATWNTLAQPLYCLGYIWARRPTTCSIGQDVAGLGHGRAAPDVGASGRLGIAPDDRSGDGARWRLWTAKKTVRPSERVGRDFDADHAAARVSDG